MSKLTKIKGFADMFSAESAMFTRMERIGREVFGAFGYNELRTPVLERTELFKRSIGDETDVVQKEMYTFDDRKGRSLTLRPEATAGVMRAYIEGNVHAQEQVAKLFTFGPMFRYERPQKGRMRQFHQINCECLGPVEPHADAEVILMLMTFLKRLGLENLTLEVNTLGCKACRPAYNETLQAFLQRIPVETLCEDCRRRMQTNPLRVLDCKVPSCKEQTDDAPTIIEHACAECTSHHAAVISVLDESGLAYRQNDRLVRGLDYYMRTTFEVVSGSIGAQSSVAGGGRYDGLIKQLGGPDVPGIGFACGMERLALMQKEQQPARPDFYIAVLEQGGVSRALLLAQTLRDAGYTGEVSFGAKSMKAQMRQAGKKNARKTLILGGDELASETVVVKDMESSEQTTVPMADITAHI